MKRKGSGSKQKGAAFEREVCKKLSLWLSEGKHEDLFWRSAMSGGRATLAVRRKGDGVNQSPVLLRRQAGDISAVAREGCSLTDRAYLECKFYRCLDIPAFLFSGRGKLNKFWEQCVKEADRYKKQPVLIAKQNNLAPIVIMPTGAFKSISHNVPVLLRMEHVDVTWFESLISSNYREHKIARFPRELGLP